MRDTPEHQCRQGRRCKARVRDAEGVFHGAGVERPDSLCRSCEGAAFDAIRCLADDYGQLCGARTEERSPTQGPKVSGGGQAPIPIPLGVDALMCAIDDETLRWAVRLTQGDPVPAHAGMRVQRCVAILAANLGTLVDTPLRTLPALLPHPDGGDYAGLEQMDGVDAVLRLASFHYRAEKVLGLESPKTNWLRESCHMCGRATLASDLGSATITCKSCHNVWDQDEFARLNNPLVAA